MLQPKIIDNVKRISELGFSHLLWGAFYFLNFNVVFPRQPTQCLRVGQVFVFFQKRDRIACFSATKTLENVAYRVHVEGRCTFSVKWTKPDQVDPAPLQRHEIFYHLLDAHGFEYFLYLFWRNHLASKILIRCKTSTSTFPSWSLFCRT